MGYPTIRYSTLAANPEPLEFANGELMAALHPVPFKCEVWAGSVAEDFKWLLGNHHFSCYGDGVYDYNCNFCGRAAPSGTIIRMFPCYDWSGKGGVWIVVP